MPVPRPYEESVFPSLSRVCAEFPTAVKIFHICERNISHVLPRLAEMGIDVLYFAADIAEVKRALGRKICLMGNLNPIELLLRGTPSQSISEARRCIAVAADEDGGFLLAPSGAPIPGTPVENIRAVVAAAGT